MSTPSLPPHPLDDVIPFLLGAGGFMACRMAVLRRALDEQGLRRLLGRRILAFHASAPDRLEQLLSVLAQRVRSWRWILPMIAGMLVCVTLSGIAFNLPAPILQRPLDLGRYAGTVAVYVPLMFGFAAAEKWFFARWLRCRLEE